MKAENVLILGSLAMHHNSDIVIELSRRSRFSGKGIRIEGRPDGWYRKFHKENKRKNFKG